MTETLKSSVVIGSLLAGMLVVVVGGCRKSDADGRAPDTGAGTDAGAQPTMPPGMLAPASTFDGVGDASPAVVAAASSCAARLQLGHDVRGGAWIELARTAPSGAPDEDVKPTERWLPSSRFLSLDAMALLSGSFSRAGTGARFQPLTARLFLTASVVRLVAELETFRADWGAIDTAARAKEKFAAFSECVRDVTDDADWARVRAAMTTTLDELVGYCRSVVRDAAGFWYLPP
jgi:hypothetical protein